MAEKHPTRELDAREDWKRTIRASTIRARRDFNKAHMIAKLHPTPENIRQETIARQLYESYLSEPFGA